MDNNITIIVCVGLICSVPIIGFVCMLIVSLNKSDSVKLAEIERDRFFGSLED